MSATDTRGPSVLPIDPAVVGTSLPPFTVLVEAGRLRQFARAIGEAGPVYLDEAAAETAGLPGLLVPPTFLFCLEMERPDPWSWLTDIGVDLATVLHAEQSFIHHRRAWSGERLTFTSRITGLSVKSGGALQLLVRETEVQDELAGPVADLRTTLAIVRPGGAR